MAPGTGSVYINSPASDREDSDKDQHKLTELVHRSGLYIFEVTSQFPLISSFRDKLIISANRITLLKRGLFYIDEYPMPIESITDASIFTHLFYSALTIETFGIPKPTPIKYLKVNEARLARRYILALIECRKANIDLSNLNPNEVREQLKTIGTVQYGSGSESYHQKI